MKKYFLHSLALLVTVTCMCGIVVPFLVSFPFHVQKEEMIKHERTCYFKASSGPYLLLEDANAQAEKIAKVRGLRVDKVYALIAKTATRWPLQIFPSTVDVELLNHELDWPQ